MTRERWSAGELEDVRKRLVRRVERYSRMGIDCSFVPSLPASLREHKIHVSLPAALDALHRMTTGVYGICCDCEEMIPKKRLFAIPSAARCVDCQEEVARELI